MAREQIAEGSFVRLKSGTEGWIKGQVVEYADLITFPQLGAAFYTGPGYKVHILEGKHKGQTIRVPADYVDPIGAEGVPVKAKGEPLYPHRPGKREPLFPHKPKGQKIERLPATGKEGMYVIGHDYMGNLIVTHTARTGDVFLQFESDRQIVYDILKKWEIKEVEKGYSVQVKDSEPRASILNELWEVQVRPQSLPQTRKRKPAKPARDDVDIGTWVERDRMGIWLTDKYTNETIAEWWDEDAREMFEQGFFKPGDIRHQTITGRGFEESVLDYAESVGILTGGGKYLAQTVRDAYYWTAINKDTGEIVESLAPYTASGRALRGGKTFALRHWKGTALIEVWKQPNRYSEKLKIAPVASELVTLPLGKLPQVEGEPVPPQYRHLVSLVSEPLPKEAE